MKSPKVTPAPVLPNADAAPVVAETILYNAKIATSDPALPWAEAVAIGAGRFLAVGAEKDIMQHRGPDTKVWNINGKTVIPGLNDDHLHMIRGGLSFNMELRWDGVPSLADALDMLRVQAQRTPAPQWVRVVGGWSEFQFAERRMPTLEEINAVAPDTPVFVLHLYDRALLNGAALRAVGYDKDTPNAMPGTEVLRDKKGNPIGLLIAKPNAAILYAALAKGPKLPYDDQLNSSRQFMYELNRLGITSLSDAGGGSQSYPDDYQVIKDLAGQGLMTVRIAYNLFTQHAGSELTDFQGWVKTETLTQGDEFLRLDGAGEMLTYSAADFEDFLQTRPDLPYTLESELQAVVELLVAHRWPFRLHATYNESITRFLNIFEAVNEQVPFQGLRWNFDHAETIDQRNIDRVKALGGGIAVQDRMAFQGDYYQYRYGLESAKTTPPIRQIIDAGIPVGAGTDGTRVASYNPWVALYWLATGKTVGGTLLYDPANILDRTEALSLYTLGSARLVGEDGQKGQIKVGQLADLAVLSADFFTVPDDEIKRIEAVLTLLGGQVVYATAQFSDLAPPALPVSPDWSPVALYGGYYRAQQAQQHAHEKAQQHAIVARAAHAHGQAHVHAHAGAHFPGHTHWVKGLTGLWGIGCDCFAF